MKVEIENLNRGKIGNEKFKIRTETSEACLINRIQEVKEGISSMENKIEEMEKEMLNL